MARQVQSWSLGGLLLACFLGSGCQPLMKPDSGSELERDPEILRLQAETHRLEQRITELQGERDAARASCSSSRPVAEADPSSLAARPTPAASAAEGTQPPPEKTEAGGPPPLPVVKLNPEDKRPSSGELEPGEDPEDGEPRVVLKAEGDKEGQILEVSDTKPKPRPTPPARPSPKH